ncbi:type II secretion system protein GspD [Luteimonas aestuarii]|uniref:Type II secretion system protein GspD n=1 Tax=Luteimonas aestuarii TaxID=453837 RepID=A0A4R5U4V7_9GAMM|nr:type II secretion system secretin GspD [Luteimonas aestuarii]TDK28679.1 type II secretion system protein GspD [Luteimonas aestuarii]
MIRISALAMVLCLALAPACAANAQATQDAAAAMRMQNVDLRAFIQDVARATGTTFIVDPRVQGSVDVHRQQAMDNQDLIGVLLAVLRANGLVAVPSGRATYRIVPDDSAAQQPGSLGGSGYGFATEVFNLQRLDARVAAETLKPLVGRGGVVMALPQGNRLLVADYADNIRRVRGLVERIDRDSGSIDTVTLRNTSAREMAGTLAGVFGIAGNDPGNVLSILPVDSSNSLVVRGEASLVRQVTQMAMDLDGRAERSGDVAVVKLQHASADQLLPVLQQLIGQAPDGATANGATQGPAVDAANAQVIAPAGGKRPTIVRYPGSNSLVIHADPDTQRTLLEVIRQLDERRQQVLVEAIVVEISDDAARKLGAQLVVAGRDGNVPIAATQFSTADVGILPLAGAALAGRRDGDGDGDDTIGDLAREAAARSLFGLSGSLFGIGGRSGDNLFGLVINAVQNDTASNLLSTPSILTLDNEEARILVGQEVPLTTGEALSNNFDNAFRTIQREDVGVQLTVRPQINAGGGITLRIKQEVSAVAGPVSSDYQELILNKREIETNVVVDDGAMVVLGGLLDQSDRNTLQKVPLLGDIPVIGGLFRSRSRTGNKTNLMVFLRPTIVGGAEDAQRETARRYGYIRDRQLRDGHAEAALDTLVREYLMTTPPTMPVPAAPAPATTTEAP